MDIHKLIAGLSPETYCQPAMAKQVRRRFQTKNTGSPHEAVLLTAAPAEPKPANLLPLQRIEQIDPFDCPGLKSPRAQFHFSRDAMAESIEAFYFSLLNHLEQLEGWQVFKLVDEFQASLLASPFADATKQQALVQRQVFEGLEAIHTLTRELMDDLRKLEQPREPSPQNTGNNGHQPTPATHHLELRRAQLRSRLALLKLRASAVRPWLQQGDLASPAASPSASLVTAFNTAVFQVTLLAVGPDVVPEAVQTGRLPPWMQRKVRRTYRPVLLLEFHFRARPHRSRSHGYAYRGKTEVTLSSYGLHDAELDALRQAVETTLLQESLSMGAGQAFAAVDDLVHRVEQLVHPPQSAPADHPIDDPNPFTALAALLSSLLCWISGAPSVDAHGATPDLHPDSQFDAVARSLAIVAAHNACAHAYHSLNHTT